MEYKQLVIYLVLCNEGVKDYTCKWDLTCDNVRSFTSISSRTDLGVAPIKSKTKN
jgi:hypothetical protein